MAHGSRPGRHRRDHRGRAGLQGRGLDQDRHPEAGSLVRPRRARAVRRRGFDRLGHLHRLLDSDGTGPARPRRDVRHHLGRREGGRHPAGARRRDQADPAADRPGADGRRSGQGGREGRLLHEVHPLLPALVRRRGAVRRGVRDLQHPLDHRRAARARVRHDQNDRRLAETDSLVGRARGLRHRARRVR